MEVKRDMTKLGNLLEGLVDDAALAPLRDRSVTGVFDDSRRVRPGGLFVALRGTTADGRRFVDDALQRGAAVVLGEDIAARSGAAVIAVDDARSALARVASRWFGLERADGPTLKVLGVTGTNGKTTTVHMTRAILRAAGRRCGMLSTVQNDLCGRTIEADMTTPGPLRLAELVHECATNGGDALVMEVSSHALDQKRTDALPFAAAAFTNLTQDHLDYHGTMDAYAAAKARLFERLSPDATAVVNRDDPAWERMVRDCRARIVTYGLATGGGRARSGTELCASVTRDSIAGTLYRMRIDGHELALENALVGRHNVYNALAAAGLARALGVDAGAIAQGLGSLRNVPGRLQRVPCVRGVDVFVDYAHTDDALRNVAGVLRPLTKRRLIVVFGCGGDRDRTKRPKMARAAAEFAHAIIVTSDNPRTEDPRAIIEEILAGFDESSRRRVAVEADRRRAIHMALACASEGDVVLIAGKGHETYQIVGTEKRHFDDVQVAIEAAALLARGLETAAS